MGRRTSWNGAKGPTATCSRGRLSASWESSAPRDAGWRGALAPSGRPERTHRLRRTHVARRLEVLGDPAGGAQALGEPGAVAVIGRLAVHPIALGAQRLRGDEVEDRHARHRCEGEGEVALARVAVLDAEGERAEIERVAADAAPDPRRGILGGQDADAGCDLAH